MMRADAWAWNGTSWTQLAPAVAPAARQGESLAFDPIRQTVVLFGGNDGQFELDDVWELSDTTWVRSSVPPPPSRSYAAMTFDRWRSRHCFRRA